MISMRRLISTPSYSQRTKKNIISPWDRTVQAMMATSYNNTNNSLSQTTLSSSSTSSVNGYNHHHHHHQYRNSNGNSIYNQRRSLIERIAIFSVLMIAWGWIMTFCGMMFYHGYQYRISNQGIGTGDTTTTSSSNMINKKSLPIVPIQKEISKHQLESRKMINHDPDEDIKTTENISVRLEEQMSPLLIFTCQRANYLQETLSYILQYIPHNDECSIGCPIIISQDGHNTDVIKVIQEYQNNFLQQKGISVIRIEHKSGTHVRVNVNAINPYEALAIHYGWALRQVFDGTATATTTTSSSSSTNSNNKSRQQQLLTQRVIILEEDLHIAPDFFNYFHAMAPILDNDSTLLAVSAFNDNGFTDTIKDPTRVLRSDFFPGLGWMMTRKLWISELQSKWPNGYWDDWLREPQQRMNRQILRPEISRTYHFGSKGGASSNQFGSQLSKVFLNDKPIDWTTIPDYIKDPTLYDHQYWKMIESATLVTNVDDVYVQSQNSNVRWEYNSMYEFKLIVQQLKVPLMNDEKAGIYRTAYKGVVETRPLGGEYFLFITPPMNQLQESFANILNNNGISEPQR